jgi:hypothetical protein
MPPAPIGNGDADLGIARVAWRTDAMRSGKLKSSRTSCLHCNRKRRLCALESGRESTHRKAVSADRDPWTNLPISENHLDFSLQMQIILISSFALLLL